MHDFSNLNVKRFEYRVPGKNPGDPPVDVSLDFDRIGFDLQMSVPSLLKPLDGELREDGNIKTSLEGLIEVYQGSRDAGTLPVSVPQPSHFEFAVRKAFRIPEHLADNPTIAFAVLMAWVGEMAERAQIKKNSPDSQGSPAPTPEASTLAN